MGLGSEETRRKIYYLSPRSTREKDGKKFTDPHFKVQMTDENGNRHTLKDETSISGYLCSIGHGEYEWPKDSGKKVKTISIWLADGDRIFKIEANINSNMIRGLMNTVAGTQKFDVMKISLRIKDDFAKLYVSNNNDQCEWRFDYKKDLEPKIQVVPDPSSEGQTMKIYHEVNKILLDAWIATEPIVAEYAKSKGYSMSSGTTSTEESQSSSDNSIQNEFDRINNDNAPPPQDDPSLHRPGEDDDLPF